MLKIGLMLSMVLWLPMAQAETILDYLTDANGNYIGPSVEDQIALMDNDHNGFADVFEVRTYLESQHGKGYEKQLFDKWELSANRKSCGTSFTNEVYQ